MDPNFSADLFSSLQEADSPGLHLHLYRLLHLLASREMTGGAGVSPSYPAARQLARRLGLDSEEKLVSLFRNAGLGRLELEVGPELVRAKLAAAAAGRSPWLPEGGGGGCDLERGLLDAALERITGFPVSTIETQCSMRGDAACQFEARWTGSGYAGLAAGQPRASGGAEPRDLKGWFMELAAREIARSRRHGRQMSLLYVDLDDLGSVNDSHGRGAGDQVIAAVGAALARSCRTEDYLWHHGEDEFAVLLSETDAGQAELVAGRLATEIRAAAEYVDVSTRISASIGFSTFPVHAQSVAELFSTARQAVYAAKALG
ncbi:MAG: diguanylate cyclase, partial [Pseudomonadota bacterium]